MEYSVKIFLVLYFVFLHSQAIEVSTRNGVIIGSDRLRTRSGNRVIYSFTGIPYAQPPVGALRFREPQPVKPWKTPLNATGPCPDCPQKIKFPLPGENAAKEIKGQEDCLRINIFTPSLNIKAKIPVMLHIHGGAFKVGSPELEPQFLLPQVVFASITYRLNVFGFATTGDGVIPANLGIKDQIMALKWIQENIETFGGDPNRVTVFGDSAGGSSVHLLLLSPLTKGLIHGGISSSGTAVCPWAMIPRELAIANTKKVATSCGCPSEPSEALLECLQKTPVEYIRNNFKNYRMISTCLWQSSLP
ncbi:unnamed protein product [Bemisia tabaci]|uniref:Carboxylic ester hydrolase n=1 Tax=Bemisia tabaci TaxID=7038 RepID=A0A9P0F0Z4_BEMTA|nr:unnamed protein product [Bemisia tabaci]